VPGLERPCARTPGCPRAKRKLYLKQHPDLASADQVELLTETARKFLRVDLAQALRAGEAALAIAEALNDKACLGRALRAKANALWFKGQCAPAAELLVQAAGLFEEDGRIDRSANPEHIHPAADPARRI
jgi:hypothetical protein